MGDPEVQAWEPQGLLAGREGAAGLQAEDVCTVSQSSCWALVTPGSTEAGARLTVAEAAAPPAKGAPAGGREVAVDKGGTCGPWPGASLN